MEGAESLALFSAILMALPLTLIGLLLSRIRTLYLLLALLGAAAILVHLVLVYPGSLPLMSPSIRDKEAHLWSGQLADACLPLVGEIEWHNKSTVGNAAASFRETRSDSGHLGRVSDSKEVSARVRGSGAGSEDASEPGRNPGVGSSRGSPEQGFWSKAQGIWSSWMGQSPADDRSSREEEDEEDREWEWSSRAVDLCGCDKWAHEEALELLRGSWIVVAGDSQARLFLVALLRLLLPSRAPLRRLVFQRHANFHTTLPEHQIAIDFFWSPYTPNITSSVVDLRRNGSCPDLLVMGAGLWHMLWVTDPTDYGESMAELRSHLVGLLGSEACVGKQQREEHGHGQGRRLRQRERERERERQGGPSSLSRKPPEGVALRGGRGGGQVVPHAGEFKGPRFTPDWLGHSRAVRVAVRETSGAAKSGPEGGSEGGNAEQGEGKPRHGARVWKAQTESRSHGRVRVQELRQARKPGPLLFWLGLPTLINARLNTERKRSRMTAALCGAYDSCLRSRRVVVPDGPCVGLALGRLSRGCGPSCTTDGMHYSHATYSAAVQIMLRSAVDRSATVG